jgi:hypothetical protein
MNFSNAIEALKEGKCLTRSIWKGTDKKFIFKQVPATINEEIVPKMQSLPDDAKKLFLKSFQDENEQIDAIYYCNQIAIVGLSNSIDSYSASAQDIFAEDWEVVVDFLIVD